MTGRRINIINLSGNDTISVAFLLAFHILCGAAYDNLTTTEVIVGSGTEPESQVGNPHAPLIAHTEYHGDKFGPIPRMHLYLC